MNNLLTEKDYKIIPIDSLEENGSISMSYIHSQSFKNYWKSKTFLELSKKPGISIWIAKRRIPLGLIISQSTLDESEIITLAVLPKFRKTGIARNLLKTSLVYMFKNGVRICHLEVATNNCAAIKLYATEGFKISGVRKNYYHTDQNLRDAHLMTKNLNHQNEITSI